MDGTAVVKRVLDNIDVSLKLIDGSDKSSQVVRDLLEDSQKLLRSTLQVDSAVESNTGFPIPVFFRKTKSDPWHEGKLYKNGNVEFEGRRYPSPSSAASALAGHNRNGWRHMYFDCDGERSPIDGLREAGYFD